MDDDLFGELERNLSTSELETGGMESVETAGVIGLRTENG